MSDKNCNNQCNNNSLFIVTGAPGSGKSTALEAFLALNSGYLAFDMDWLLAAASTLAGKDIRFAASRWKAYNQLWLEVLHGVVRNSAVPILFAPISPEDELPPWCSKVEWLLLDCPDTVRRQCLSHRSDWGEAQTDEALQDAHSLRGQIETVIATDQLSPNSVAEKIQHWVHSHLN